MRLIYMAKNIPLPRFKPKEKKEGILLPRPKPKEKKVAGTDKLYSMMGRPSPEDVIIRGRGEAGLTEEARRVYESARKSGQQHTKPLPEEEGGFFSPLVDFFAGDSEEDIRPITEEELYGASLEEQKLGLPFAPRKTTKISREVRKALIEDAGKFPLVALGLDPRRVATVPEWTALGQYIPHKDDPKSLRYDHLEGGRRELLSEKGDRPYLAKETDFLVAKTPISNRNPPYDSSSVTVRSTIYHEGMHRGIADLLTNTDYKLPSLALTGNHSLKVTTEDKNQWSSNAREEILVRLLDYRDLIPKIDNDKERRDEIRDYQIFFRRGFAARLDIDKLLEDPKINAELDKLNSMAQKLREEKGHSSGETFKNYQSGGLNISNGLGSAPPSDPFHPPRNGLVSPKQESGYYYDPDTDEKGYIPTEAEKAAIASDPRSLMTREDIEAREDILAPHKPTWREEGRATIQDFLTSVGMDKHAARNFAESTLGNPASERKLLGLADVIGLDIPYLAQEQSIAAKRAADTGDIGGAAMHSGIAAASVLPLGFILRKVLKSKKGQAAIQEMAEDFTKRSEQGKSPVPIGLTTEDVSIGHNLGPPLEDIGQRITATKKPRPDIDELGFYSVVGRAIDELPLFKHQQVAPGDQVLKAIIKRGATKEEIHESGLAKFLEGKKKVTQQEVQDYFKANQVKLSEVVLKDQADLPQLEWGDKSFISSEEYKAKKTEAILDTLTQSAGYHGFRWGQEFKNIYRYMNAADENKYPMKPSEEFLSDSLEPTREEIRSTVVHHGIKGLDPETKKDFLNALDTSIQADIDVAIEEGGNFELFKTKDGKYEIFGHNSLDWNTSFGADEGLVNIYNTLEEAKIQTQAHEQNITMTESEVIGARWREYASPGGENYEELLLTVPRRPDPLGKMASQAARMSGVRLSVYGPRNYNDPHYRDIKDNIVAHLRTTKRDNVKVEGEIIETLHAEEIQSKVHSEGREYGYVQEPPPITEEIQAKLDRYNELRNFDTNERRKLRIELAPWLESQGGRIADLPFKKTWHEFTFNRLVYKAIKEGKNAVSWTVGKTQADRYDDERLIPFYDEVLTGYAQTFSNKHGGGQVTKGSFKRTLTEDEFLNLSSATPDNILSRIAEKQREEVWVLPITKEMRESVLKEGNKRFKTGGLITKQKNFQSGGLNMARTEEEVYDDTEDQMDMMGFEPQEQSIDPVSGNEVPLGGTPEGVRDDIDVKMSKGEMVIPEYAVNYHGVETYVDSIQKAQRGYDQMKDMGLVGNPDEAIMDQSEPLPKMGAKDIPEYQFGGLASAPLPKIPTPTIAQPVTQDVSTVAPLPPVNIQTTPIMSPYPSGYFIEIAGQPNMFKFVAPPGQQNTLTGTYTREQIGSAAPIAPVGTTSESVYGPGFQTYTPSYTMHNIPSTGGYKVIPYTNAEGNIVYMTSVNGQIQGTIPTGYSPSVEEAVPAPQMQQPIQAPVIAQQPPVAPGGPPSPPSGVVGVTPPSVTPAVPATLSAQNQATVQSIHSSINAQFARFSQPMLSQSDIAARTAPDVSMEGIAVESPVGDLSHADIAETAIHAVTSLVGIPSVAVTGLAKLGKSLAFHGNQTQSAMMQGAVNSVTGKSSIAGTGYHAASGWSVHAVPSLFGLTALVAYNDKDVTAFRSVQDVYRSVYAPAFVKDLTNMTTVEIQNAIQQDSNGNVIGIDAPNAIGTKNGMVLSDGNFYSYKHDTTNALMPMADFKSLSKEAKAHIYALRDDSLFGLLPSDDAMGEEGLTEHSKMATLADTMYGTKISKEGEKTITQDYNDRKAKIAAITKTNLDNSLKAKTPYSASYAAMGPNISYSGPTGSKEGTGFYSGRAGHTSPTGPTGTAATGPSSPSSQSPWCWVARKVYGEDNPKWQIFRSWLCTQAPKWLYKAYGKYGESFAEWLDGKERTQKIIRKWMDKRIQKYLDTQPKTAQEIGPL